MEWRKILITHSDSGEEASHELNETEREREKERERERERERDRERERW